MLRLVQHLATVPARGFDERLRLLLRGLSSVCRVRVGIGFDLCRARLGLARSDVEDLGGLAPHSVGSLLGLVDGARGALFGLLADVVARLPGRTQQPRRFLAEGIEQLLLVERARRAQLRFEVVHRDGELAFPFVRRGELLGHTLEERSDFRFREATE